MDVLVQRGVVVRSSLHSLPRHVASDPDVLPALLVPVHLDHTSPDLGLYGHPPAGGPLEDDGGHLQGQLLRVTQLEDRVSVHFFTVYILL